MRSEKKITLAQWSELTFEEKERLRQWTLRQGYELDIVPGSLGTFDPVCDFAALLTCDQMVVFLQEQDQKVVTKSKKHDTRQLLWEQLIKQLRKTNR